MHIIFKTQRMFWIFAVVFLSIPTQLLAQMDGGNIGLDNPITGADTLMDLITLILNNIILPIGGVIAVVAIIWSGFLFVKARGKPDEIQKAKSTFLWTVIGIAILLGATLIAAALEGTLCEIAPNLPGCDG